MSVVFATSDASQETMQFAKDLGVELFLKDEFTLVKDAEAHISMFLPCKKSEPECFYIWKCQPLRCNRVYNTLLWQSGTLKRHVSHDHTRYVHPVEKSTACIH